MADKSPKAPGYYWLALDNSSSFFEDRVFLVRVKDGMQKAGWPPHEAEYRSTVIEFIDPSLSPIMIDDKGLDAIAEGTVHRVSWDVGFGGFVTGVAGEELRLNWLGAVKQPKLPAEVRA